MLDRLLEEVRQRAGDALALALLVRQAKSAIKVLQRERKELEVELQNLLEVIEVSDIELAKLEEEAKKAQARIILELPLDTNDWNPEHHKQAEALQVEARDATAAWRSYRMILRQERQRLAVAEQRIAEIDGNIAELKRLSVSAEHKRAIEAIIGTASKNAEARHKV